MQDENVIFAYLFGSLAGGAPKPLSDVDIAVYLLGTKTSPSTSFNSSTGSPPCWERANSTL